MNRGIDTSAVGMAAAERYLDVVANNLANASTNGYKQDGLTFGEAFERELRGDGGRGPVIGSVGTGATIQGEYTDFTQGPLNATGNALDFALTGDKGAFAVQTPQGVRYTRNGSFMLNAGQLTTSDGFPVLDDSGRTIDIPPGLLQSNAGTITVNGASVATLGVYDGTFSKQGGNLFSSPNAKLADGLPISSGAVEGSNVSPIESMIEMIKLSREYELAQKSITSQDDMNQQLVQSMQSQ